MKRYSLSALLIAGGAGVAIGFGAMSSIDAPAREPVAQGNGAPSAHVDASCGVYPADPLSLPRSTNAPSVSATVVAPPAAPLSVAGLSVDELIGRVGSDGTSPIGTMSVNRLHELVRSDPASLRMLIKRYEEQPSEAARAALRGVLESFPAPEVLELSRRLTLGTASQRKDGYELLRSLSDTDEARGLILQALDTEQSPDLLAHAVGSLQATIVDPRKTEATIERLGRLARSPDPQVRGAGVVALAQWDKSGSVAEPSVYQAMIDPQPEIQSAALMALTYNSHLHSERLKSTLIHFISTSDSAEAKMMAMQALERYSLNEAEFAVYDKVRGQIRKR